MKPSLTELRVFTTLADTAHFTRASERLGMTQSTLSASLSKLERMMETRLFDRHTRGCRLTESGKALLPAARRLVNDWNGLLEQAKGYANFSLGHLSIAAPSAQCALLLPPLLRQFVKTHPGIRVTVHDVAEQEVHALVRAGVADLGIATQTDARSDLLAAPFYSDQYILALPKKHPMAKKRLVEWKDLADEPVIGPLSGNPVRRHLDERLAAIGLRLRYAYEVSLPWTMVGMVRENLGMAVLTTALQPLIEWLQLASRPLGRPAITRTLVLLRAPNIAPSPASAAFRNLLTGIA